MTWRTGAAAVAALALIPLGTGATAAQAADPTGTVSLGGTVPSEITLMGGTEAGIFYATDSSLRGQRKYWVKAADSAPVQLAYPGASDDLTMVGRMVFRDNFPQPSFSYTNWNGPIRTCDYQVANRDSVRFVPDGGLFVEAGAVKKIVTADSGCTTVTVLPPVEGVTIAQIAGGDQLGFALDTVQPGGAKRLAYYPYADLAHPVTLDRPETFYLRRDLNMQAGALLGHDNGIYHRVPIDGGQAVALPTGNGIRWTAMTKTVVAGHTSDVATGDSIVSVPATGGEPQYRSGPYSVPVADGISVFSGEMTGEAPGIYRRASAQGAATLAVPLPTTRYPSRQTAVAVQPGRISYSNTQPGQTSWFQVMTRTTSVVNGRLTVGAEQSLATNVGYAALSGSSGWLVFGDGQLRDPSGVISVSPKVGSAPPQVSGNRALVRDRTVPGSPPIPYSHPALADLRTRALTELAEGARSLFGNYLAYANPDGSVRVKDLARNVEGVHRPAGSKIGAVALHGKWIAWVTACPTNAPCAQTLTIRDTAAKTQRTVGTRGTTSLKLSGGFLALDVRPVDGRRDVRTIKLGTTISPVVIAALPVNPYEDVEDHDTPDHFDLDDETLAWVGADHVGKAVRLAPFIDPPVYLGNVIAPASMSTTWSLRLPVSKALPTCQVSIYYGTTKVRILNCANTDGMVKATWDGKSGSGGTLAKGTYTYRVTGLDADKYNLRNYNGTLTPVGGSFTKTV